MILTEKEKTSIEDLRTQEKSLVEKYRRYGSEGGAREAGDSSAL